MDVATRVQREFGTGIRDKRILLMTLSSPFLDTERVFPYLGVLYLLAVAKSAHIPVYFLPDLLESSETDGPGVYYTDEFRSELLGMYSTFDVVALSCMTPQGEEAGIVRNRLKTARPDVKVMVGGPHATHYTEQCIRQGFDYVMMGDGERLFAAILSGDVPLLLDKIRPESTARTLVFSDWLSQEEMNALPLPFRETQYIGRYQYSISGVPGTTMMNSRGCPMGCAFCESRHTEGRWYSPDHFRREIEQILDLGYRGVMIFDDLFAVSPHRLTPYLEILRQHHQQDGLVFRCFGHANVIARFPELGPLLAGAGCVEIGFGAESASQQILDTVYKGTKVEDLHRFVEVCADAGICVKAFFMIGLPGESHKTFAYTRDFVRHYRQKYPEMFDFDLVAFFPYKGTIIGNAMRLPDGAEIRDGTRIYTNQSFNIRLNEHLTWVQIDSGAYGAYKKKGGMSDVVVHTYNWDKREVLLPPEAIKELKEHTLRDAMRYTDSCGRHLETPLVEGSIGSRTAAAPVPAGA
ncbi:MAG: B12-binding domain-containing radical SAM protein [Lentisphaeria bacterium]|nr:B12-binding domain-containing radical SAM protein [Lentisphaeria bacterium]